MCTVLPQWQNVLKKNILKYISVTVRNYSNVSSRAFIFRKTSKHLFCSSSFQFDTFKPQIKPYSSVTNKNKPTCNELLCVNCALNVPQRRKYCDKKDTLLNADKNGRKVLENVIEHNKEMLRETEQRLRARSSFIIEDIKATRNKMKEKMEEVIERENIYTIPNFLCVSRIAVTPYLGALIVQSNFDVALAVLGLAALTDLLDGWIARTWKSQSSKVGSFLDPMADKILIATLFLTLTYSELIPLALTAMIITRDIILVIAGFVIRYRSLPPPRTLARYFDASHVTAQLAPTFISKANTVVQLLLVGSTLAAPVFHYVDHPVLQCLWYITGATTIAAGLSYVISKDTYKYLRKAGR